jgi:protocatechuate 3,4-dioxygenase beta subunit
MATVKAPTTTTEDDITREALARYDATPDPRLRQIMQSLVRHLHGFVKDVRLTEGEWFEAIKFLTATGHKCDDIRQEFILLSDTLGVSMVVDLINHRKPAGATESTVFGPFHREGVPRMQMGDTIAPRDAKGTPLVIHGRVLDTSGRPLAGATLDVWQANSDGFYDQQLPNPGEIHMRGLFTTGADGAFVVKTTRPVHYQIPTDGPVGQLLRATNRHPWRPAHTHFVVAAPGHEPVTTHIFDSIDPYLKSDAVFGVKESLIVEFGMHQPGDDAAKRFGMTTPFATAEFDFVLKPAAK